MVLPARGASVTSVLSASIPLLIPLTRFTIDDSSSRKRFTRFSNRTLDGSSLRGWLGSGRADGTVVHQVLRCQSKAQMIDNAFVQQVKTIAITADELWSFKKQQTTVGT